MTIMINAKMLISLPNRHVMNRGGVSVLSAAQDRGE
jgi:hypothetical protein